jgi:WD40 repeat protein
VKLSRISALLLAFCIAIAAQAQTARQGKTINLPTGVSIEEATISHAGNLVAAVCSDHAVRVWSVRSGELLWSLNDAIELSAVQFSNDERLLAVAYEIIPYEKGGIKIFDVNSREVRHDFANGPPVWWLAFSPDGRHLAGGSEFGAYVWDASTGKRANISPPFGGSALAFSPDGARVATAGPDGFVRLYDSNTGALHSAAELGTLLETMTLVFSPDGKTLLVGGVDKTISVVEAASGKIFRTIGNQPGLAWSLVVSADGKQAAAVYRSAERFLDVDHIRLWDLNKATVLADFQKPGLTIQGGTFVGDHYILIASSTTNLTLWSIQ